MEKIIEKRKELKLSKAKFAEKFGIPTGTYVQWESGRRKPPPILNIEHRTQGGVS